MGREEREASNRFLLARLADAEAPRVRSEPIERASLGSKLQSFYFMFPRGTVSPTRE